MGSRKRKLTDADRRAALKVRSLWADYKKQHPGISQEAAAALAGFTQSAFSQFLLGTVPMRVTPVIKFAKLFGVEPKQIRDDLVELRFAPATTAPKTLNAEEPAPIGDEAMEIARVFGSLSPQTREMVREHVFLLAVMDRHFPWLRKGRPKGESYDAFEKRHEENYQTDVTLEAQRQIDKKKR